MTTSFFLENNVLVLPNILMHKSGWNGTICDNALAHPCNPSNHDFRRNHCALGKPSCNHMHIFDRAAPGLKLKSSQLPYVNIEILNEAFANQIMLFHAHAPDDYECRHSTYTDKPSTFIGLYQIREITRDRNNSEFYLVHPYPDRWVRFPKLVSLLYHWTETDDRMGSIKSLPSRNLKEILYYMHENRNISYHDEDDKELLQRAVESIDEWLLDANQTINKANKLLSETLDAPEAEHNGHVVANNPFKDSEAMHKVMQQLKREALQKSTEKAKSVAKWQQSISHLPEKIQSQFHLAWRSKPFIILSGEPGSGKSQIARDLVDKKHRHIVSVSSSFNTQEDLFGYYNPINSKFHGFGLVDFLIECETAWQAGDRSDRVVILEEMNIAQPEHYMSDILTKTQYPETDFNARTIHFPGSEIEGHPEKDNVMLSPAIKFVATVNTDHSVRKLTQRVLDRAAIIKIEISPSAILSNLEIKVPNTLTQCLTNLNAVLDGRYRFSYRTGQSLSAAIDMLEQQHPDKHEEGIAFQALDMALVQEVWPRISSSLRNDFQPEKVLESLNKWISEYNEHLQYSSSILEDWNMRLEQGGNLDTLGI